jgi:predicted permease
MDQILAVVIPVFGLIGLGYLAGWTKLLGDGAGDALSEFVFMVAIPVLVFRIMANADLAGISAWRLWLAFFSAFAICWAAGTFLMRRFFGRDARGGLVGGLAAGYGNTTLIGLPLAIAAFGHEGSVPMALIIGVQLPVMMTAIAFLMVRAERQDGVTPSQADGSALLRSIGENLVTNPIIIGLFLGTLWRLSGIPFTGVIPDVAGRIADVASTVALFAMGLGLRKYGIRGHVSASIALSAVKLMLMPALVVVFARLTGLPDLATKVTIIATACPTGVTPFLVANRFKTGEGLASNTITISTILGVISVTFWLNAITWF